jgi:benzoylformate decarboxylase
MHGIGEILPPDAVLIDESVSSSPGLRQFVRSEDPQSFFGLRGGGIGWGLPAAIGAKLALPDRPVVGLIGDGSAMYTCQALWTAAHESVPVVFVIINNASYRILKQRANAMRAHAAQTDLYVGMDLVNPRVDFVGLARSLGVAAERATTVAEVCALIKRGISAKEPLLIDAQMDMGFKPV